MQGLVNIAKIDRLNLYSRCCVNFSLFSCNPLNNYYMNKKSTKVLARNIPAGFLVTFCRVTWQCKGIVSVFDGDFLCDRVLFSLLSNPSTIYLASPFDEFLKVGSSYFDLPF